MEIVHLTSVHQRYDTRIFLKMCRSAARAGHSVVLIVADGKLDEVRDGVSIVDVGAVKGRVDRMLHGSRRIFSRAAAIDADIYHIHDPELLPAALRLKRRGKRVIFDAHEDLPKQIMTKDYLRPATRRGIAYATAAFERYVCSRLDAVVTATPAIRNKFAAMGCNAIDINNYPLEGELEAGVAWENKQAEVCFVGGMTALRGIVQVVEALALTRPPIRLNLCGVFSEADVKARAQGSAGWQRVNEHGHLPRGQVRDVLGRSVAGIVTFLPAPNHIDAQPNKMFEYMSAGIPVIGSNFPLWREILEGNDCGICVDPLSPIEIAAVIDRLITDPDLARRLGANGRRAVAGRYNWSVEEKKLLNLYTRLA